MEETLQLWKGPSHVADWFDRMGEREAEVTATPKGFLENFFEGR